jgi:predicted Zn-dependent protease
LFKRFFSLVIAALTAFGLFASPAGAVTFIRDAEMEATIAGYVTPLFEVAGLDPSAVHVYLIKDDAINAFVAGGMNIFIYTGLLMKTERPAQLIGVIAHETGHIAGGHLARAQEALREATIEAIVACVLGVGAAAASGNSAGVGGCALGSHIGQQAMLSFTRTQESAADQAGLSFLDATHQSARGIFEFLTLLAKQEVLLGAQQDPYLRTHPLTQDRIDAVRDHVEHSPYSDVPDKPEFVAEFKRMRAKLFGFLQPARALQEYPETDESLEARYARAIAYCCAEQRLPGKLAQAQALIDGLIAEHPDDPYFQELKGQMLFENGRVREAVPYYAAAAKGVPGSALLQLELAQVQIESEDPSLNKKAIAELELAVRAEPKNPDAWHFLSIAYGRDGQLAMMALALAEQAATSSRKEAKREAKQQAQRAMQGLPVGSPAWLRAQDIYNASSRDDSGN